MKSIFKNLVIISYITYVIWFFLPYIDIYGNDQQAIDLLTWAGYGATIESNYIIAYTFLVAYTISSIGLYFFIQWARPLYMMLTVTSVVVMPIFGFSVLSPIDGFFLDITTMSDGAILAIMYLTSISNEFIKNV